MPSSKTVTVERFVNGMRDVRYSEDIPIDHELVVEQGDDGHTHLIFGDQEHLEAAGLVKPKPKPAAKKPAARKAPAKKPAARKKA